MYLLWSSASSVQSITGTTGLQFANISVVLWSLLVESVDWQSLLKSFVDFCSLFESLACILDCIDCFYFVTLLRLLLFFPGRFKSF